MSGSESNHNGLVKDSPLASSLRNIQYGSEEPPSENKIHNPNIAEALEHDFNNQSLAYHSPDTDMTQTITPNMISSEN